MSAKRIFEPHLVLREVGLKPAAEWRPEPPGWVFALITAGQAYSVHAVKNQELAVGVVIVFPAAERGYVRASHVEGSCLRYFHVEPDRLLGLITLGEQRSLLEVNRRERSAPRVLGPEHPVAEMFRKICAGSGNHGLPARMRLLEIFTETLADDLASLAREDISADPARLRIEKLLRQMPTAALVNLKLDELVQELGCTHRHVSRVFHEVVGTCFRQKQSEVRLMRAQELLATTNTKVLDVAMESGFQSMSLFNVMFKKRFGNSPGEWRERFRKQDVKRGLVRKQLLTA